MLRAQGAARMPPDRPLPEADIELVERWILNGATWGNRSPFDAGVAASPGDAGTSDGPMDGSATHPDGSVDGGASTDGGAAEHDAAPSDGARDAPDAG